MHILVLPSWFPTKENPISGIFSIEQAEALAKYGNQVSILEFESRSIKSVFHGLTAIPFLPKFQFSLKNGVNYLNIQYVSFPRIRYFKNMQIDILSDISIMKYKSRFGIPDIVHLHSFAMGEAAIRIKKRYHIPFVVTEHLTSFARDLITRKELRFAQNVFKAAAYRIAVSNEFCRLLYEKTGLKFSYIPNLVNTFFFECNSSDIRKKQEGFVFINVASLDSKKNHKMLLQAFYAAFKDDLKVKLCIVGRGPLEHELQQMIDNLGMQERIFLLGQKSRNEVKSLLCESDAFVLSSKIETFCVAIIEALSCGLPVIATKSGGPESIITDRRLGELVECEESALIEAMRNVYSIRYDKKFIRDYAVSNFSEGTVVKKLSLVYAKVIANTK